MGSSRMRCSSAQAIRFYYVKPIPNRDEIQGNPRKALDLIDKLDKSHYLIHVGLEKGKVVTDLITERKPQTMMELGGYVGYSAISCYNLELNPEYAVVSSLLIDLAGLRDFVQILVSRSDQSRIKLDTSGEPAYTTDVKLREQLGMIVPNGSVLVADNVLRPGNPPYLEYVRSTVEQKRKAAEKGPIQIYNIESIPASSVRAFIGESSTPLFDILGNPNLVYESILDQPKGLRDTLELSRCIGLVKE
ncbi:uncharacterized protein BDW43DRAFT_297296 [Aspergillus alliaceus]|uniref:uncharacterized protein n=1 Tax=Petromyces alliaceus TaxID=209559 RepID=UPI0012A4FDE2|nr:uncharacterized protein BDW43DRAFT_297296 [Aspergillus alliaceus]KAB8237566.1 hypothetical protein BDW43DRAFT_297296 [Aspergillus alliaceus]